MCALILLIKMKNPVTLAKFQMLHSHMAHVYSIQNSSITAGSSSGQGCSGASLLIGGLLTGSRMIDRLDDSLGAGQKLN